MENEVGKWFMDIAKYWGCIFAEKLMINKDLLKTV